jgi:hypothetical protein
VSAQGRPKVLTAKRTSVSSLPMSSRRFAERVRDDLRARRWLRWHCTLIALLTLATGWAGSHALMHLGADALWLRYGAALALAYAVLLLLLYLWARWLLSRDEGDWPQIDGGGSGSGGGNSPGSRSCEPELPTFKSGGGGDFGGAGGGGSFEAPGVPEGAGEVVGGALEIAGAADEGAVVLIPLALAVGIAVALGTVLGFAVFGLFGVEVLLAVAVEIALASAAGALAYKAGAEGWLSAALRRTWKPALAAGLALVMLGGAIDHWLPQAQSLPHAVRLLRG